MAAVLLAASGALLFAIWFPLRHQSLRQYSPNRFRSPRDFALVAMPINKRGQLRRQQPAAARELSISNDVAELC